MKYVVIVFTLTVNQCEIFQSIIPNDSNDGKNLCPELHTLAFEIIYNL